MRIPRIHLMIALAACAGMATAAQAISPVLQELEDAFIRIGDQVRPCVVNIDAEQTMPEGSDNPRMKSMEEFFRYFNIPMPEERIPREDGRFHPMASGSGFIYDKEGHIITNNHVIENASALKVRLSDGSVFDAEVIGRDPDTDIAVIKINAGRDLPVPELGDSDTLKVGQFAIALGSPRGLEGSLSFGHVSALGRDDLNLPTEMRFQNFVQTDAAINLGNSGGPLCDIDGRVIGINTAIVFGAESLGFAIPINMAKRIVPQLIEQGKITRGFLGVSIMNVDQVSEQPGSPSIEELVEVLGLPDTKGAYVDSASPDSPAEKAGIKSDDVIRKVNGEAIADAKDLVSRISDMPPGATVKLEVWRAKAPVEIDVKLAEYPGSTTKAMLGKDILGMRVQAITPELRRQLQLEEDMTGVVVVEVDEGSPAEAAEITSGDIILEVAQQKVTSVESLRQLLEQHGKPGESVLLRVTRPGERPMPKVIKVPAE
ncbi:MAG: Do family serine endopeptidase [Candidatus Hydrogenedentes bacterium]|nr:Do family serine endopeptidase [Candidatus Hydrogenedentota bacterium]